MKSKKTQYMSIMAMFLAIQIILVVTPLGYLPIGPISATTMHIPVIIAGIALGKKAGAQLGFVFGLTSVLNATFRPTPVSYTHLDVYKRQALHFLSSIAYFLHERV